MCHLVYDMVALQSPEKISRRAVNIWVMGVELSGPVLSAPAGHQLSVYCTKELFGRIIHTWHQWTECRKQERQTKDYLDFFAFFSAVETLLELAILQMINDNDYLGLFVICLVFIETEPLLKLALLQMFNHDEFLGFFTLLSLPPNPFWSWISFKCLTTALSLASSSYCFPCRRTPFCSWLPSNVYQRRLPWLIRLVFLAAEPPLKPALFKCLTMTITLPFSPCFPCRRRTPFCSWLSFKCLTTTITLASSSCLLQKYWCKNEPICTC